MTTATAPHMAGEELMALVDGELTGAGFRAAEEHLASCELCAGEVARLQNQAFALDEWSVPNLPHQVEAEVLSRLNRWSTDSTAPKHSVRSPQRRWLWIAGAALAACAVTLAFIVTIQTPYRPTQNLAENQSPNSPDYAARQLAMRPPPPAMPLPQYEKARSQAAMGGSPADAEALARIRMADKMPAPPPSAAIADSRRKLAVTTSDNTAPMIARTVALTLAVKDIERSRLGLEDLLRTYNGYAAQMEVSTPDGGKRSLRASLRVPTNQMRPLLAELKGYGKVANETQSGEEVGQQHADLVARLNTSRQSEERLRGILKTRTGDVSEVLQVEREIARVREQIESMEAAQQALEHRVVYATVELQMFEEGQGPTGTSVASRLAAGARQGWENATETGLGLAVFLLQYGLATLLLAVFIGTPIWLIWRRFRTARSNG